jgi:hypothetical protein
MCRDHENFARRPRRGKSQLSLSREETVVVLFVVVMAVVGAFAIASI